MIEGLEVEDKIRNIWVKPKQVRKQGRAQSVEAGREGKQNEVINLKLLYYKK